MGSREIDAMLDLAVNRRIERGQLWYYDEFKKDLAKVYACLKYHPHASLEWMEIKILVELILRVIYHLMKVGWRNTNLPSGSANAGMVRNLDILQLNLPFLFNMIL